MCPITIVSQILYMYMYNVAVTCFVIHIPVSSESLIAGSLRMFHTVTTLGLNGAV